MAAEALRSTEVILQLLQLIALTLPVVAILTQVMVRGMILERDGTPSRAGKIAFVLVGVTTLYLGIGAINLIDELRSIVSQPAIEDASSMILSGFGLLALAIVFGLWELWEEESEESDETINTQGNQASLEDYEDEEQ